jgi:hypothetical protein
MAVIPHPPYSPDLAPCDFFLFPKMKLKLKGRSFDAIENIQAESQRVLDTLTEKDFQQAFQEWRSVTGIYMREGTTSSVMAAERPYGVLYDFYIVSPEYFGYFLVRVWMGEFVDQCECTEQSGFNTNKGKGKGYLEHGEVT